MGEAGYYDIAVTTVPEPSTFLMTGFGLAVLLAHSRRSGFFSVSPVRGGIIEPGVQTPGDQVARIVFCEPRQGRHHRAWRVNAGRPGCANSLP